MSATESPVLGRALDALRAAQAGTIGWREASQHACAVVGADAGAVIAWRKSDHGLELLEHHGYDSRFPVEYTEHYFAHDLLMDAAERVAPNQWIVSDELYPWSRYGSHIFFGDFLNSHRVRQIVALVLSLGDDHTIAFTFARHSRQEVTAKSFGSGDVGAFARAACEIFAHRELTVANARRTLHEVFLSDTSLCFLADVNGRVQSLGADPMVSVGDIGGGELIVAGHLIRHRDTRSNDRLMRLVAAAARGRAGTVCLRAGLHGVVRVEARPAPTGVKLTSGQTLAFVRIEKLGSTTPLDAGELQLLFELTPAQARILALLYDGLSPKECADKLGCGMPTVRTHIAQLMERMGCTRQTQLIRAAMMATKAAG